MKVWRLDEVAQLLNVPRERLIDLDRHGRGRHDSLWSWTTELGLCLHEAYLPLVRRLLKEQQ
jgi:hypothetical protein